MIAVSCTVTVSKGVVSASCVCSTCRPLTSTAVALSSAARPWQRHQVDAHAHASTISSSDPALRQSAGRKVASALRGVWWWASLAVEAVWLLDDTIRKSAQVAGLPPRQVGPLAELSSIAGGFEDQGEEQVALDVKNRPSVS